jgi:hypothetical protein
MSQSTQSNMRSRSSGIATEQLEDAPDGEEVPHLKGRRDALDVGAAADHNGYGKVSFLSASGIPN